jgi:prephenate dehydratase
MRIAIQGELGSNSHMAALAMLGDAEGIIHVVACGVSAEVFERVVADDVDGAVLPIENSLHGSVAEHYDLLLSQPVRIDRESQMRIRHNVIARPGVAFRDIRRILSHPVALAQCRRFLDQHRDLEIVPFYDTAGSVKRLMEDGLTDAAGIAPMLAAQHYGAEVLVEGIEDHASNFTRFHLVVKESKTLPVTCATADKMSVAFAIEHRPGSLAAVLALLNAVGVDLTKIESRPVPGSPWEYVFHVDLRFERQSQAEAALTELRAHCRMVKELGRYTAA